jgi:hypothetical protein
MEETIDKPKRSKRDAHITLEPILVSREVAAAMLAQISVRSLDQLVAEGKIKARQISKGRVGYLYAELKRFAEDIPVITPGS